jgi:TfoX/Sxy family transcriptional regulator of competence genes
MTAQVDLAARVRTALAGTGTVREVKMFGGIGFMLDGNMVAAVSSRGLLLRVGKESCAKALRRPGMHPVEMRGRTIAGYVRADPAALGKTGLEAWLRAAVAFVRTLPPKPPKAAGTIEPKRKGARK